MKHPEMKVKARILLALTLEGPQVPAGDLCQAVYGRKDTAARTALRNHSQQMKADLAAKGLRSEGRNELKRHAYRLRAIVL